MYGISLSHPPIPNDQPSVHDLVIMELPELGAETISDDLHQRKEFGLQKYGTPLQAFNGRDGYQEVYHELLDAIVYAKKLVLEGDDGGECIYRKLVNLACEVRLAIAAQEGQ